jgi:hypothetical protein
MKTTNDPKRTGSAGGTLEPYQSRTCAILRGMRMPTIATRDPTFADWTEWHRMRSANCAHFGVSMSQAHDRELWRRLMAQEHPVGALVYSTAYGDGKLLGLAHYVLHPHTFSPKMVVTLKTCGSTPLHAGPV